MEGIGLVLQARRKLIIASAVAAGLLVGLLSLAQPLEYSATVRLLITQKSILTLDPYTALRSTELISNELAQLVKTSAFLDRVLQLNYGIETTYFSRRSERARRNLWERSIAAEAARGGGFLRIRTFHPKKSEALKLAAAASFLLSTQAGEYLGREITVRLVDPPLVSRFPVRPNLPWRVVWGALLGGLSASVWIGLEHRKKKHHGHWL